ncbi:AbrB/MazE/SpoVT family DNA-binding domain-containing protein [Neorhizobium sp. NPDC001467]|uniref:AbrB/MazE/SpoVT family DNA-binding domain-containing protein n=1 Tax=Neorhizobium sp. NPDC001467 TaxID=3390595 RepID=UPI003D005520
MRVTRWNDALAVQIPDDVARSLDLKEGDEVTVAVANNPSPEGARQKVKNQALERIKALRLELPSDWKFDREEANAR